MDNFTLSKDLKRLFNFVPFKTLTKNPEFNFTVYGTEEDVNKLQKLLIEYSRRKSIDVRQTQTFKDNNG